MSEEFLNTIKSYLDQRAKRDKLFAKVYRNPRKNIEDCCKYILQEVKKMGPSVALCDEEVYCMAVHYYDEELVSIEKGKINYAVVHTEPTNDDKPMLL